MNINLSEIKWGVIPIVNYRGRLVEYSRKEKKYKIHGQYFNTPEEVDTFLNQCDKNFENAILRGRGENISK